MSELFEFFIKEQNGNLPYRAINYRIRISENCGESEVLEILKAEARKIALQNPKLLGKFFLANRNISYGKFGNRYIGFIKIGRF